MGGSGSTAWAYTSSSNLTLVQGGALTAWGQNVAAYTAGSGNTGCNLSPVASLVPTTGTVTPSTTSTTTLAPETGTVTPDATATGGALVPQNSLSTIRAPSGMN